MHSDPVTHVEGRSPQGYAVNRYTDELFFVAFAVKEMYECDDSGTLLSSLTTPCLPLRDESHYVPSSTARYGYFLTSEMEEGCVRRLDQQERAREDFMRKEKLHPQDMAILEHLADTVKEQQWVERSQCFINPEEGPTIVPPSVKLDFSTPRIFPSARERSDSTRAPKKRSMSTLSQSELDFV